MTKEYLQRGVELAFLKSGFLNPINQKELPAWIFRKDDMYIANIRKRNAKFDAYFIELKYRNSDVRGHSFYRWDLKSYLKKLIYKVDKLRIIYLNRKIKNLNETWYIL